MRYNEAMDFDADKPEMEKASKKDKKEPRVIAGSKDYDYSNLIGGKELPLKGGNPWS